MIQNQVSEQELIEKVVDFLNMNGFLAWRQQNSGHFSKTVAIEKVTNLCLKISQNKNIEYRTADVKTLVSQLINGSYRKIPNALKGISDVIGYEKATGRWIAAEIKIGTDYLSMEQDIWLKQLKKSGAYVYVVRDFEQFVSVFREKQENK